MRTVLQLSTALLLLCLLNGCAALAVSLAGAGAGAGFSHQLGGTATRTFSEKSELVDAATQIATRKMYLEVSEVVSISNGQSIRARVSDLEISIESESLSPTLTRISVIARKNFLQVDSATAQEIVTQIESALQNIKLAEQQELARAQEEQALKQLALDKTRSLAKTKSSKSRNKRQNEI